MLEKLIQLIKGQIAVCFTGKECDNQTWLFSSKNNSEFNYNSKYLFLYVLKNCSQIKPLFVINDDEKRVELQRIYGEEYFIETCSIKGMMQALKAGVWFTSAGLPVYALGLKKKHLIVNLWHGIPLKKIALCEESLSSLTRFYFKKIFSENYTYVLTTSKKLVPVMAESFCVSQEMIKVWGQPKNDLILDERNWDKDLSPYIDISKYKKVVLYAPTFRDNGTTKWFPFEDFDLKVFQAFLEENEILFCLRPHLDEKFSNEYQNCKNIFVLNSDVMEDVTECLYLFDMLITDYSSIYIEYLLLNRPIVFLPYDKEEYISKRGLNFEYDEVTPGEKPETFQEFIHVLKSAFDVDALKEMRMESNEFFNQIQDVCSKEICDKIWAKMGQKNEKCEKMVD